VGVATVTRFNFKKLDVYRAAVEHYAWSVGVVARLPTSPFAFRSQVLGAALSIAANIAEANGRDMRAGEAEQHNLARIAAMLDRLARRHAARRRQPNDPHPTPSPQ
jgi:hypothetical protein